MKKTKNILSLLSFLIILIVLTLNISAKDYIYNSNKSEDLDLSKIELYPGGMPFGVKIQTKGLQVVKFIEGNSPAKDAGIKLGDLIIKVNNTEIDNIEDFTKQVDKCGKSNIIITVLRDDKELSFKVTPTYSQSEGKYKTGIWIKDSTSGIGTITFVNPENNAFGGLGHGICNNINGKVIPLSHGTVLDVKINGVLKGQVGQAGELRGVFNTKKIGSLAVNSSCGVFGLLSSRLNYPEEKMKLCFKEDLKEGNAYIWCTLGDEKPQKYDVTISNIDISNNNTKNFKVKITDKRLLDRSGGIVQGMSGSPIIQNGKIVGAVTHVLINDPTEGYGIFIENMLSAMPEILK